MIRGTNSAFNVPTKMLLIRSIISRQRSWTRSCWGCSVALAMIHRKRSEGCVRFQKLTGGGPSPDPAAEPPAQPLLAVVEVALAQVVAGLRLPRWGLTPTWHRPLGRVALPVGVLLVALVVLLVARFVVGPGPRCPATGSLPLGEAMRLVPAVSLVGRPIAPAQPRGARTARALRWPGSGCVAAPASLQAAGGLHPGQERLSSSSSS